MAKDAVETMGTLLPEDVGGRDAVHVAVVAVTAGEELDPGQRVGIDWGNRIAPGSYKAFACSDPIGIVDPFLLGPVSPGMRFWLFLFPRTITGLCHRWTHPAFPEDEGSKGEDGESKGETLYRRPGVRLASERWLRNFCATSDCPGYEVVMEACERIADGEVVGWDAEYIHFDGRDAHGQIPSEFWYHVEIVLGRPIKGKRATSFSCSC